MSKNTIVWLDHQEARILRLHANEFDETTIRAPEHHVLRHPKGGSEPKQHPDDAKRFFGEIVQALQDFREILVVGPGTAKLHFLRYAQAHGHGLDLRIVGVETVDHPSDKQLVAYARAYFPS
jgi:stalled ribosome rescue protein Dom34